MFQLNKQGEGMFPVNGMQFIHFHSFIIALN